MRLLRARKQDGFGLIELLMAMTILNIGLLAIVAAFNSGAVAIRRASRISTASALADSQMELYRALTYTSIALDSTTLGRRGQHLQMRHRPRRLVPELHLVRGHDQLRREPGRERVQPEPGRHGRRPAPVPRRHVRRAAVAALGTRRSSSSRSWCATT